MKLHIGAMTLFAGLVAAAPMTAQVVVVTPTNPQGWGADPFRVPPFNGGTQAITSTQPHDGNGSLEMSVPNDGQGRTGFAKFSSDAASFFTFGTNVAGFGQLSNLTTLQFDWMTTPGTVQSPTLRLYLNVANPNGGRMIGQYGWYADGVINGPVSNSFVTSNLLDNDGNNNFFLRFFSGNGIGGGNLAKSCVNTGRTNEFTLRMQDTPSWLAACTGQNGTVNLSDATIVGYAFDMGAYPGNGLFTDRTFTDDLSVGYGRQDVTTFNFEVDSPVATPEPASLALLATGLAGLGGVAIRRRRNRK